MTKNFEQLLGGNVPDIALQLSSTHSMAEDIMGLRGSAMTALAAEFSAANSMAENLINFCGSDMAVIASQPSTSTFFVKELESQFDSNKKLLRVLERFKSPEYLRALVNSLEESSSSGIEEFIDGKSL